MKTVECPLKPHLYCAATRSLALSSSCVGCPYAPPEIIDIMPGQQGYSLSFEESSVYGEYWRYHPTAGEDGDGAYIPSEKGKHGSFPVWIVETWEALA